MEPEKADVPALLAKTRPIRPFAVLGNIRRGTLCTPKPVYVIDTDASKEASIRKFTLGLVGVAAVAAGLLLMRQQKQTQPREALVEAESASSGAITSGTITLERMRELGL